METITTKLTKLGFSTAESEAITDKMYHDLKNSTPEQCWQNLITKVLTAQHPFKVHEFLYKTVYPNWDKTPAPAWFPRENSIKYTHIAKLMRDKSCNTYEDLHHWTVTHFKDYWETMTTTLNIRFDQPYKELVDLSAGVESPKWFKDAKLNITNSCFQAKETDIAIVSQTEQGKITKIPYGQLNRLSNRIANSLTKYLKKGDRVAIVMPMTHYAVAIYLGIIKAGCVAVSIPDSFASDEIAVRLRIADVKAVFCQDLIVRDGKHLPLYERMIEANSPFNIVIPAEKDLSVTLRNEDRNWDDFLDQNDKFTPVSCDPHEHINILFSSGTTGEPKAIPWTQTAPIKCASDAYLHHNIKPGDVFCWPTNLGWMMGPWLIFATLLNKATIALYEGTPNGKGFGEFIQNAEVNLLGVVPTIVRTWRDSGCMEGLNWNSIKLFTSTGERSNTEDMLYLMSLVNYRPIIEYCGGTEIAGAYITGTIVQPSAPAACTTPALGLDFVLLDEEQKPGNNGEVALIPPSIGLSTELLNKDHHKIYYADMPKSPDGKILRRHGDQAMRFENGFYRLLGRVDDTMKLGGIKVSSAEIEATVNATANILETAAIAVNPSDGGPSQLIIYAVLKSNNTGNAIQLKSDMQNAIKNHLNPLFKIHDVIIVDALPRTASNKVMRRVLRDEYLKQH